MAAGSDHPGAGPGPLAGHHKYEFVKDLNKGSYGFVQASFRQSSKQRLAALPLNA